MREYTTLNGDIAHCDISDFYPAAEEALNDLLGGDEPFTFYGGAKKDFKTATIVRKINGSFEITVHAFCDEDIDLINDALHELGYNNDSEIAAAFGISEEDVSGKLEELQAYIDHYLLDEIFTEFNVTREYPANLTIEGIKEAIRECAVESEEAIKQSFQTLSEFLNSQIINTKNIKTN